MRPCFAVMEAAQVTRQFRHELIGLYNNMKHHMETVVQKTSIREVLDHHFETYKSQIVDKSYHLAQNVGSCGALSFSNPSYGSEVAPRSGFAAGSCNGRRQERAV